MTPKEKATELVNKFYSTLYHQNSIKIRNDIAKKSALIAVDEIIDSRKEDKGFDDTLLSEASEYWSAHPMYLTYWQEVKKEIENK